MDEYYKNYGDSIIEANKKIKTMQIHSKEYAPVNERTKAFRSVFPLGTIQTDLLENTDEKVTIKASVIVSGQVLATGHASENKNEKGVNETDAIENCETSAVGRALGFCGFGIDTAICSSDDLENIENNELRKATEKQVNYIKKLYDVPNIAKILNFYVVERLEDLSFVQAKEIIGHKKGSTPKPTESVFDEEPKK